MTFINIVLGIVIVVVGFGVVVVVIIVVVIILLLLLILFRGDTIIIFVHVIIQQQYNTISPSLKFIIIPDHFILPYHNHHHPSPWSQFSSLFSEEDRHRRLSSLSPFPFVRCSCRPI